MRNPALVEGQFKTYKGRDEVPQEFDAFWDGEGVISRFGLQTTNYRGT